MGKAAATEPSMDDILSSIRQIISDDDVPPDSADSTVNDEALDEVTTSDEMEDVALKLTSDQIVEETQETQETIDEIQTSTENLIDESLESEIDIDESEIDEATPAMVLTDDISFENEETLDEPEVNISSTLPDPDLSSDMTEKLLEPATDAAVANAFAKLGNLGFSDKDLTIENMIREMLRPMLKVWLDENLPSVVETMVRKEIERLSRGA